MNSYSIYIFKTTKVLEGDDWHAQSDSDDVMERAVFEKEYNRFIKSLEKIEKGDIDTYDEVFKRGASKLCDYFNFPDVKLKAIGVNRTGEEEFTITPVPLSSVRNCKKGILEHMFHKVEGMYNNETGTFLFPFLKEHLDKSYACWISVEFMNELVSALTNVIDSRNKEYTKEFKKIVRIVRKDFKRFIKLSEKNYKFYSIVIVNQ